MFTTTFSATCGTGIIDENESKANVESANKDGMEVDTESVSSQLQSIIENSDDSQIVSRPNSSLNCSFDSQEVRRSILLFSNVKLVYLK